MDFDINIIVSICIFIVLLIIQYFMFFKPSREKIRKAKSIFPDKYEKSANEEGIVQISPKEGKDVYNTICSSINDYIEKNSDSIELGEMKDIADRICDKEFEEAIARTSFPMYIGLMGTYLGIGWGLGVLLFNMGDTAERTFDAIAVYGFLGGVIVAMLTSLVGLFLTTVNNNFASKASSELDHGKDNFIAFLQTSILPQLPSTLVQTLKEVLQTSISALGETIYALDGTVKSLNTELKTTFEGVTKEFGDSLSHSLNDIHDTVVTLTKSAEQYADNIKIQDEILNTLRGPAFAEMLEKIVATVEKCHSVADTINQIGIQASSIVETQKESSGIQVALLTSQKSLLEHQKTVGENFVCLQKELSDIPFRSQEKLNELMNQPTKMFEYIKEMMEQFKKISTFVEEVSTAEFAENAEKLKFVDAQIEALRGYGKTIQNYLSTTNSDLLKVIDKGKDEIKSYADNFIKSWNTLFSEMVVNGQSNPLVHLKLLDGLDGRLNSIESAMRLDIKAQNDIIVEQLKLLNNNIEKLGSIRSVSGRTAAQETTGKRKRRLIIFGRRKHEK